MVAMMANMQRYCLPILIVGAFTGLLTLIPKIGWLLGFFVAVLAWRYTRRSNFLPDLLLVLAIWMVTRELVLKLAVIA